MNSPTRYSPEAPAEGLYQVGLFTSALSHLYHGYFKKKKNPPDPHLDDYYNYHIDFKMVMSHFRVHSVMMFIFFLLIGSICIILIISIQRHSRNVSEVGGNYKRYCTNMTLLL